MINRALIRIKVVQMLYSYLLTRSEFKIDPLADNASRDAIYAHALCRQILAVILELSGYRSAENPIPGVGDNRYLKDNRMIRAIATDPTVRGIIRQMRHEANPLMNATILTELQSQITSSAIYRSYIRQRQHTEKDEIALWTTIIRTIIAKSNQLITAARTDERFTMRGYENGCESLIKILESYGDSAEALQSARNSLQRSLDKAYELYHALLLLSVEITRTQDLRLDAARHKYLPTPEDLNPNMRFVDNCLPRLISESQSMQDYIKSNPISWDDDPTLIRTLLESVLTSDLYRDYMALPSTNREIDCEFWRNVYKSIILPSDVLAEALESKSVYWNDDLDIMGTFVLKTVKRIGSDDSPTVNLLPKYKDEEDARFGAELFTIAVDHFDEYRELIERFIDSSQWDPDRLAFMDMVIMVATIGELLNFPNIPLAVTLNEYIEIANAYSTPRSGHFINGIIYSIIKHLQEEGRLIKR